MSKTPNSQGSLKSVMKYFGMTVREFQAEWFKLTQSDKEWFKTEVAKANQDKIVILTK